MASFYLRLRVLLGVGFLGALSLSGCSSTGPTPAAADAPGDAQAAAPVEEDVDDEVITARVKAKLTAHPEVNPFDIEVDTRKRALSQSGAL